MKMYFPLSIPGKKKDGIVPILTLCYLSLFNRYCLFTALTPGTQQILFL